MLFEVVAETYLSASESAKRRYEVGSITRPGQDAAENAKLTPRVHEDT
jgi:hypothetical protein